MFAVMLGVVLARFARVMSGVRGMAVRGVRVVTGLLVIVVLVMGGRLAMVLGGMLVMLGRGGVVLDDLVLGHDALRLVNAVPTTGPARSSAPASVPLSTPLAYSSASECTSSGTIAWAAE